MLTHSLTHSLKLTQTQRQRVEKVGPGLDIFSQEIFLVTVTISGLALSLADAQNDLDSQVAPRTIYS